MTHGAVLTPGQKAGPCVPQLIAASGSSFRGPGSCEFGPSGLQVVGTGPVLFGAPQTVLRWLPVRMLGAGHGSVCVLQRCLFGEVLRILVRELGVLVKVPQWWCHLVGALVRVWSRCWLACSRCGGSCWWCLFGDGRRVLVRMLLVCSK